mgnify:CR=1 FL=1
MPRPIPFSAPLCKTDVHDGGREPFRPRRQNFPLQFALGFSLQSDGGSHCPEQNRFRVTLLYPPL